MGGSFFLQASGDDRPGSSVEPAEPSTTLQAAGLHLRTTFGAISIFATSDTSMVRLPNDGVVLGALYSLSGEVIRNAGQLACPPSSNAIRHHILENCWGDYVIVMPEGTGPCAISITRSPSHACELQCVYSLSNGKGFVTSDISLAVRLGLYRRRVDFDYMAHRLIYPDLKTSRTGLAGVNELLPGCTLLLQDGNVRIDQAWSPWNFVGRNQRYADGQEAASAIRRAIMVVVNTWADRDESVLLELSGGLDSSIVGACLKHSQATVACGTLTTPVPGGDEREYGSLVARMLGTELSVTELRYDAPFDFAVPQEFVTPVIGPLQYAVDRIMEATAERSGANSYFSGAGGDTVFCYLTNAAPAVDAFRGAGLSTGIQAVRDISAFHQCTYWKAGRLTLRKLLRSKGHQHGIDHWLLSSRTPLPEPELHPWLSQPPRSLPGDRQRIFELSATQFFRDSCPRGLNRPVRMPLLSQPVIEACLRAPSWMWFSGGQNRAIARSAFSDVLPPMILARKSKGSFTAYLGALYRRKVDKMLDFLLDGELESHGLLDGQALRQFSQGEPPRSDSAFMRMFQLCTLENWIRQQSRLSG
ncbi:MAG TPA: asparagine synthase C-terminal domain-containing protein [Frateuria sp.]|uniref:asparagine synthase C-terminal domain-containing protein n=1 Tax=Frateuria sp. TaxID=2211372 RepID=UPI002DF417D4|nr:asparagine synthase C-terminal domain-containing protein [Frateuria sp.]